MDLFTRRTRASKVQSLVEPVSPFSPAPNALPALDKPLTNRVQDLEARMGDLQQHYERRLGEVQKDLARKFEVRWESFESADKRFKEHVRIEQDESRGQLVNLKTGGLEYILQ